MALFQNEDDMLTLFKNVQQPNNFIC